MMTYKFFILISFIVGLPFIGLSQNKIDEAIRKHNSNTVEYISVEELIQLKNSNHNFILLDTREASEYSISHLQDAIFAGYDDFNLKSIQDKLTAQDTIVVYCSIGVRSEKIGERLQDAGYKTVFNLYGGIFDWVNKGQQVYDIKGKHTRKIHTYNRFWGKYLEKGQKVY